MHEQEQRGLEQEYRNMSQRKAAWAEAQACIWSSTADGQGQRVEMGKSGHQIWGRFSRWTIPMRMCPL